MKRSFIIILGLLLFGSLSLGALEIELIGGLNNLTFHPDSITAYKQNEHLKQFSEYPYFFGDFHLKNDINSIFGFSVHASRDSILRNSISGSLFTNTEFFKIEFGLFSGMNDRLEIPDAGIIGGMEFIYPGIFYLSINGSSSLGSRFDFMNKNSRETFEFKLGFWLPNTIPTLSISIKNYTEHPEDSIIINDELIRFQFSADIFAKNFPFIFRIDIGYEILKRSYISGNLNVTDELSAFYAGLEAGWQITKPLRITAGFEIPVFMKAVQPMQDPANIYNLYKARGGISYTFF